MQKDISLLQCSFTISPIIELSPAPRLSLPGRLHPGTGECTCAPVPPQACPASTLAATAARQPLLLRDGAGHGAR
jgi:hypothetical protein